MHGQVEDVVIRRKFLEFCFCCIFVQKDPGGNQFLNALNLFYDAAKGQQKFSTLSSLPEKSAVNLPMMDWDRGAQMPGPYFPWVWILIAH